MVLKHFPLVFCLAACAAQGQAQPDVRQIVERLERLEALNRELMSEIRALRQELTDARGQGPPPSAETQQPAAPLAERVEIQERRAAELDQTKVQASQRFPVQITGTLLFNTSWTGRNNNDQTKPTAASLEPGVAAFNGTLRQTTLGLRFQGPSIFAGGKVTGSLYSDFYAGTGTSLNQLMRIRVATIDLEWNRTTLSFAQDKPIMATREPASLSQVGVSPLTAAGNLWLWQPQIRIEHRFLFGDTSGLRLQGGVYQTSESTTGVPSEYLGSFARSRPGLQGRVELWKEFGEGRRIEVAPGFHASNSRVAGREIPSRIYAVDWLIRPDSRFDISGTFFGGQNVGTVGGLRPSISFLPDDSIRAVSAFGGFAQLTYRFNRRTWFNVYAGQQSNDSADLLPGAISRNFAYAGNVMYRLAGNVVASFEAAQVRTRYLGPGTRLVPYYDLAIAYLY